jgi:HEAT repeat protein
MNSRRPPDPSPRQVVVAGHQGDLDTVVRALTDDRAPVRHAALGAAARLGALDDDRVAAALGDPDRQVRRRAVELAGRSPRPSAAVRQAVLGALGDDDTVAEAAAFALGELGDPAADVVDALASMALDHGDPLCREAAVAALGALEAGVTVILRALERDRATVRRRAVIALAPFEGPQVEAALRGALQDRDWQVRQAAEDLLEP